MQSIQFKDKLQKLESYETRNKQRSRSEVVTASLDSKDVNELLYDHYKAKKYEGKKRSPIK